MHLWKVMNMSILYKLYLTRMKANIRHVFSRKGSAIFAILMMLLYGGLIVMSLSKPEIALSMQNITDANMAIMIGVGFTALMVGVMLLQKRKALFMEADAFYLFSGPFTRVQTMRFLMLQNIASAFLCGAVSLLMVILLGSTIELSFPFLLIAFLCFSFVYFVFLVVYYYVYLLSIQKDSYRHIPAIAALLYVLMVAAVYGMVVLQNDFALTGSGTLFLNTELFYWVPLFGWIKMILVSYIASSWGLMLLGIGLLLISCMAAYLLLCGYKGDFVERAMQDAQEFTALYKDVRAGKRDGMSDRKIHEVKASFRSGAMAIFSKNVLLLRKSNDYIRWTDVMTIGIYLVITLIMDMGFGFFMYMMMFWLHHCSEFRFHEGYEQLSDLSDSRSPAEKAALRAAADLFEDAAADECCNSCGGFAVSDRYCQCPAVFHHAAGLCNAVSVSERAVCTYFKESQQRNYGEYAAYADHGCSSCSRYRADHFLPEQGGVYTGASTAAYDDFAGDEFCYIGYHCAGLCTDDERQRNQKRVNLYKTYGKEREISFPFHLFMI